jgi:hypothetical protein
MAIDDYGRLVYHIGQLEEYHIMHNVPYRYRASFSRDVQFLKSSSLTASEKLKIIDLMYKRYPFLVHDPRYAVTAAAA